MISAMMRSAMPELPSTLACALEDGIAVLRLCRAQKRNALDIATIDGLDRFFSAPPAGIRAVVLHGEGAHFSAGLDLSDITEHSAAEGVRHSQRWHRTFARMEGSGLPIIAVLHGAVVGGGLELAAVAHVRVAERGAFYALPEGTRGIYVGGGASVRLPRLIGLARMTDMMLTGRTYGAEEGVALGFSQYLVEPGEGLAKGMELARKAAANTEITNFAITQALPRIARTDPDAGGLMESLMAAIAESSDEAKARLEAFLQGRATKVRHDA